MLMTMQEKKMQQNVSLEIKAKKRGPRNIDPHGIAIILKNGWSTIEDAIFAEIPNFSVKELREMAQAIGMHVISPQNAKNGKKFSPHLGKLLVASVARYNTLDDII